MTVISHVPVFNRRKVHPAAAASIKLTEKQRGILQQMKRSNTAPQRLVQRAHLILLAFAHELNVVIAVDLGLARKQIGLWKVRWQIMVRSPTTPTWAGCS